VDEIGSVVNVLLTPRRDPVYDSAVLDDLYRRLLLPPIRRLTRKDAETAHEWFLAAMRFVEKKPQVQRMLLGRYEHDDRLRQTLLDGVVFPTPFGIAAGLDKNASMIHALEALTSAGFVEVGTVTPRPQCGNPRPRIVRANKDNLINAMGFPNEGMDVVRERLLNLSRPRVSLGLNVGKMKETSDAAAIGEYASLIAATAQLRSARQLPDYYVVNVSSPNTPGLASLQKIGPLTAICNAVVEQLDLLSRSDLNLRHRLLIKLGADIAESDIEPIVDLVVRLDIGGLIATNTTTTRPIASRYNDRPGGFSGSALFDRSAKVVRYTAKLLPRNKVLVATGGVDTVDRAYEMLRYADLIGGYTGLVLKGPRLLRRLSSGIATRMEAAGVKSLDELRKSQRPGGG